MRRGGLAWDMSSGKRLRPCPRPRPKALTDASARRGWSNAIVGHYQHSQKPSLGADWPLHLIDTRSEDPILLLPVCGDALPVSQLRPVSSTFSIMPVLDPARWMTWRSVRQRNPDTCSNRHTHQGIEPTRRSGWPRRNQSPSLPAHAQSRC